MSGLKGMFDDEFRDLSASLRDAPEFDELAAVRSVRRRRTTRTMTVAAGGVLAVAAVGVGAFAWGGGSDGGPATSVSPTPSPSVSESPSATPTPSPTPSETVEAVSTLVENPAELAWPDVYSMLVDDGGVFSAFFPDGDYPGVVPEDGPGFDGMIDGGAPGVFPDVAGFDPLSYEEQQIGLGDASVIVQPIDGGLMQFETAEGDTGYWLVAPVLTDTYSAEPRWAMCRYLLGSDVYGPAEAVFCSQMDDYKEERYGYGSYFTVGDDGALYEFAGLKNSDVTWATRWSAPEAEWEHSNSTDGILQAASDPDHLALNNPTVSWEHP